MRGGVDDLFSGTMGKKKKVKVTEALQKRPVATKWMSTNLLKLLCIKPNQILHPVL